VVRQHYVKHLLITFLNRETICVIRPFVRMIDEYKDLIDEENLMHYVNIPGSTTLSNSNITVKCGPRYKSLIGYKFDVILIDEMDEELKSGDLYDPNSR